MSPFPTRLVVTRHRPGPDIIDELENKIPGPPISEPVRVFGWAIPTTDEPGLNHSNRTVADMNLYARPGDFRATDSVSLPGDAPGTSWQVEGDERNYENNPWWSPGLVVIELRKVTG